MSISDPGLTQAGPWAAAWLLKTKMFTAIQNSLQINRSFVKHKKDKQLIGNRRGWWGKILTQSHTYYESFNKKLSICIKQTDKLAA